MSDQIRAKQSASVVHPFLAVFIPFWFMLTVIFVMVNSALLQSEIVVFPPFFVVLLLLVGISETLTGNLLYKERIAGILPRLREFAFILIFGLFFILLFHGEIGRGNFNIGRVKIWLPMLFLAIEWFMSYYIHQKLRERELFLNFFEGKAENQVRDTYNSFMHEGGESLKAIKSVKGFIIALTVIGFLVLNVMSWGFRFNFRGMRLFILLVFFGGNILITSVLNTWSETQFILMDGLIVSRKQRRFRISVIVLLFAVLFIIAVPAAGQRPLLPESYISAFFDWLQRIGSFERPDVEVEPPEITATQEDYDTGDYLGKVSGVAGEQSDTLANITRIIGYILLGVIIIVAIVFLLRPLFKKGEGIAGVKSALKKAGENIRKAIEQMRVNFQAMLETLRNRRKSRAWNKIRGRGTQSSRLQQTLERAASRMGLSRKERRVNNRVLRSFFRFTKWGEKRGVPFKTTMGALEYASKLNSVAPGQLESCVELADVFEEIMYSDHTIQESLRSTFYDKVKEIVRAK